jgi:hypothetical protein
LKISHSLDKNISERKVTKCGECVNLATGSSNDATEKFIFYRLPAQGHRAVNLLFPSAVL